MLYNYDFFLILILKNSYTDYTMLLKLITKMKMCFLFLFLNSRLGKHYALSVGLFNGAAVIVKVAMINLDLQGHNFYNQVFVTIFFCSNLFSFVNTSVKT